MGWSEWQTLHSDVNAIQLGFLGHVERLQTIHGKTDTDNPNWVKPKRGHGRGKPTVYYGGGGKPLTLTPKAFDAVFDQPRPKGVVATVPKKSVTPRLMKPQSKSRKT